MAPAVALARAYLDAGVFPVKFRDDARHVAVASVHGMQALVSWNFKLIVKLRTRRAVSAINALRGYDPIEWVAPIELLEEEEE